MNRIRLPIDPGLLNGIRWICFLLGKFWRENRAQHHSTAQPGFHIILTVCVTSQTSVWEHLPPAFAAVCGPRSGRSEELNLVLLFRPLRRFRPRKVLKETRLGRSAAYQRCIIRELEQRRRRRRRQRERHFKIYLLVFVTLSRLFQFV